MKKIFRRIHLSLWKIKVRSRFIYFSYLLDALGSGTRIYGRITLYFPENIKIGQNCTINEGVVINGREKITIGDNVRISPYTIIETGYLDYQSDTQSKAHQAKKIIIKDNVWIASGARILAGVTVGEGAIVASGAVVTKDVPAKSIAKGIPAKTEKL